MLKEASKQFLRKSKAILLILTGAITWSLTMVRSGLCWNTGCTDGLGFWGANGHDGIWHIALINSLSKGDFQVPIFSGWNIQNYHLGFDILLSWISKLSRIPPSTLYFQITPPILALLIGILTYKFVYLWRKSENESLWAVFFIYFGGSFGWLISLIRGQGWGGESMFWSQQSISTLINPPFALSLITILMGLIFLVKFLEKKSWPNLLLMVFFFGVSIFIKVYAGLLVLSAILGCAIWQVLRKKDFSLIPAVLLSMIISAFLFISFSKSSIGLIIFSPFWFLESMMTLTDRFGWQKMHSAMTTYRMGDIWLKAIFAYGLAFVIFIVGNFGTRLIALKSLIKMPKKLMSAGAVEVFIFIVITAGIIVPTFFVQKGTPWNTIQFFYYSLTFTGIVAGIEASKLIKKLSFFNKSLMIIFLVLLTLPTTIASMGHYFPGNPQSILPDNEKVALNFLSKEEKGIVLTYPFDAKKSAEAKAPRPLYLYTSTAYISAFSGQPVFLEDQINLDIMQYPWQERRILIENFIETLDIENAKSFIKDNNIKYIYWLEDQHARIGDKELGLTRIFYQNGVSIFRVD